MSLVIQCSLSIVTTYGPFNCGLYREVVSLQCSLSIVTTHGLLNRGLYNYVEKCILIHIKMNGFI